MIAHTGCDDYDDDGTTTCFRRTCIRCGAEIDKCMGFVLARDIVNRRKAPREFCGKCALITEPDEIDLYVTKEAFWHYCQDGNKSVRKWQQRRDT